MKASSSETLKTVKVVLVGESGTGKTSIIQKYCKDIYNENSDTTFGSASEVKYIHLKDRKTVKLDLWDTAGQEAYRAVNKIFYKDANIVIFVYDITNGDSFKELVNYWYNEVKDNISENSGKNIIHIYIYIMS